MEPGGETCKDPKRKALISGERIQFRLRRDGISGHSTRQLPDGTGFLTNHTVKSYLSAGFPGSYTLHVLTGILFILVIALSNPVSAQRLMDANRSTIGNINEGRVRNEYRSIIGYIEKGRILNANRATLGYFEDGRVLNANRVILGYIEKGRVLNANRSTLGYMEKGRVLSVNRATLGYYEDVVPEDAALFFFFFFGG